MPETRRSYHEQLEEIRGDVVKLAAKTCEQIGAATQAMLDGDLPLVDRIYVEHDEIAARVVRVEQRVYQLFALQQPMASDLRELLAVLRILHEIELTAGLMRNVARATRRLYPRELPPRVRGILERMGAQASVQMHLAVDAFADTDAAIAIRAPRHGRRDGRPPEGAVPHDLRRRRPRRVRACRWRCNSRSSAATTNAPRTTRS